MNNQIKLQLLGLNENLLMRSEELGCSLHSETLAAVLHLRARAAQFGFDLRIASSFRNFERQLLIWNNKALGIRPVLDSSGNPLDINVLTDCEKVFAILRWSALPGASRHHWGTDLDVYDASSVDVDYKVQLTQAETEADGPFAEFHRWLDEELQREGCKFYRPYSIDRGGIAPEPWHLSYTPLAKKYVQLFTLDVLREQLEKTPLELKSTVLENLDEIFRRFICVD
ncbi:MAG TPA: M15 family metallopeptidase [Cellvibrio sp.]|nr:M15 family metallopeptidase [Cellvibrio sp.]